MSAYAHPEVLVDTQWVAEHLTAPKVRFVEVGYDTSNFNSGHIPGAVGWGWNTDFQHSIRKDLPDKWQMEHLLARSGIESDSTITLYGTRRNGFLVVIPYQVRVELTDLFWSRGKE